MLQNLYARRYLPVLGLATTLVACGDTSGSDPAAAYRDAPALTLEEVYRFCADESIAACQLGDMSFANAATDGAALIWAVGGPIARFDTTGAPPVEYGRPGSGPGEYRRAVGVHQEPDGRVVVTDLSPPRRIVFAADGTPLATRVDVVEFGARWLHAEARGFAMLVDPPAEVGDSVQSEFRLLRDTLPPLVVATVPGVREASVQGLSPIPGFFADRLRWAVESDSTVLVATGPTLLVIRRSRGGAPDTVVNVPSVGNRAVTPADVSARLDELRESRGPIPAQMREPMEQADRTAAENAASLFQFAAELRMLGDGAFILKELETTADSARWTIFTNEGEPIGQLRLPVEATVAGGTRERLLLMMPDERDVPVVAWYRVAAAG